jgi:hypothetical protein
MNLKNEYPNFVSAINQMKDTTDLTKGLNNSRILVHVMSYKVFGNKLGDIYINLNKYKDFVYVSFSTNKGFSEKARTTGDRIYADLSVKDWQETIAEMANKHNANPNHTQLVSDFTMRSVNSTQPKSVKNSGCMVSLLFLFIPVVSYFF